VKGFVRQSSNKKAVKACKKIIKALKKQQHNTRHEFTDCYTAFSSADNQNKFKEMFVDYHASR
jgi:hypothetical protein